jgi:hypothetical protein
VLGGADTIQLQRWLQLLASWPLACCCRPAALQLTVVVDVKDAHAAPHEASQQHNTGQLLVLLPLLSKAIIPETSTDTLRLMQ